MKRSHVCLVIPWRVRWSHIIKVISLSYIAVSVIASISLYFLMSSHWTRLHVADILGCWSWWRHLVFLTAWIRWASRFAFFLFIVLPSIWSFYWTTTHFFWRKILWKIVIIFWDKFDWYLLSNEKSDSPKINYRLNNYCLKEFLPIQISKLIYNELLEFSIISINF